MRKINIRNGFIIAVAIIITTLISAFMINQFKPITMEEKQLNSITLRSAIKMYVEETGDYNLTFGKKYTVSNFDDLINNLLASCTYKGKEYGPYLKNTNSEDIRPFEKTQIRIKKNSNDNVTIYVEQAEEKDEIIINIIG